MFTYIHTIRQSEKGKNSIEELIKEFQENVRPQNESPVQKVCTLHHKCTIINKSHVILI